MLSRLLVHFLTYSKFGPYRDALLLHWVKKVAGRNVALQDVDYIYSLCLLIKPLQNAGHILMDDSWLSMFAFVEAHLS